MDLIVDSNIVVQDLMMASPIWQEVWTHLEKSKASLLLPGVVRKECSAKHLERCGKLRLNIVSAVAHLGRLVRQDISFRLPETDGDAQAYITRWDELITEGRVKLLPEPGDGSIQDLQDRAIARTPPFDSKGDGFRNGLIWLSVREHVRTHGSDIAFISNDKRAYCSNDMEGVLHPRLQSEIGTSRLLFFTDLRKFLDEVAAKVPVGFIPEEPVK